MQERLTPTEKRGLLWAGIAFALGLVAVLAMSVPEGAVLRDETEISSPLKRVSS